MKTIEDVCGVLMRIAEAIERQCEQHESWRVLQESWRAENVAEHKDQRAVSDRRRDEELAEMRETNASLLEQIDRAIANQAATLALYERGSAP